MIATSTLRMFAVHEASFFDLDTLKFIATIQCESGFIENKVGDDGASVGAVQIDRKYNPAITDTERLNGYWSIAWMAKQWSLGHANLWSCYSEGLYKRFEKSG